MDGQIRNLNANVIFVEDNTSIKTETFLLKVKPATHVT
jgi:hypothetical protein